MKTFGSIRGAWSLLCFLLSLHVGRASIVSEPSQSGVSARIIYDDPEFVAPIGNLTTPIGREAVLSCRVEQLGNYKVGWLKAEDQTILTLDNRVVTHNSRISVTHDHQRQVWQLHIRQVKESDRGCYMCQVNTNRMKKQVGCVDVHVPPDILSDETSPDLSVQEGDNATLLCRATGHPPPKVTWKREDGESIFVRTGPRNSSRVDVFIGNALHFWRVERRQMGAYLCIASNEVPPAVSKRVILNVNFAPVIKVPNQLLGAPLGTDVQLECYVEAFPNTINYWLKNQGEMLLDGPKYMIKENKSNFKVVMWLLIRQFSGADIGTYKCVSTNSLGKAEGTLRLYEIKLHAGISPHNGRNHVTIVGGLAEAAHGGKAKNGGSSGVGLHFWGCLMQAFAVLISR
ncbi:UNVERIFIED_CONTAM: hypothetical protein PYX00_006063 [Menopon gallinae]|uniref:Ig-like domain-containing protein n=1 Tax=Menopon gallinae TaxID=328185 RepID=A0AAW2HVW4_9NEOP